MADQIKDRANIPASPACGQWETLLVDAMDGLLRPEDEAAFSGHMATCSACTAMFEEVRRGREWLEFLAPEPEVPAYLLDRILLETGHGKLDAGKLVSDIPVESWYRNSENRTRSLRGDLLHLIGVDVQDERRREAISH